MPMQFPPKARNHQADNNDVIDFNVSDEEENDEETNE